jgi:tetratricopeptide (TPR) repeat protein
MRSGGRTSLVVAALLNQGRKLQPGHLLRPGTLGQAYTLLALVMTAFASTGWLVADSPPAAREARIDPPLTAINKAFTRLYNFDFAGAEAILDEYSVSRPADPLTGAVRAGSYLFSELYRLQILQTEFFLDDTAGRSKGGLKPDPALRLKLFQSLEESRKRARERLANDPADTNALFALCMAAGVETDYTAFVEGRRWRGLKMAREAQAYALQLLARDPPFHDAHLTAGTIEYIVGSLPFFLRWFIRFDQVQGDKEIGIQKLRQVAEKGVYFRPYAKILLAVIYLREKKPDQALQLLEQLSRDYPENPLISREAAKLAGRREKD